MGRNRARTTVWTRAPLPSNTPSSSLKNAMEQRTDKYVPKGTDLASSSKKKAAKGVEQTEIILGETYEDEEEATFPTSPLSGSALSPPVAPPPLSDASSSPVAASTELAMAAALEALSVCGDDTHWTLSSLWDEIDSALSIIRSKSTLLQVTDMSLVLDKVRAGLAQGIELPLGVLARVWKNLEEVWDSGVALHKSGNISEGTERDVIDGLDRLVSSALGLPFGDGAAAVLESWSSHLHTISSAAFIQDLISSVVDEASNLKVNPMRPWLVGGMFLEHSSVQSDPSHVSAGLHTRLGKLLQLLEESSPNYAACIKSLTVSDVLAVANAVLHRFVWWNSTAREHVASIRRVLRHPPALGNAVTRIQLLADVQKLISREMTSSASCMDIQHIPSTLSLSSSALEELSKRMHTVFLSMQPSKRDEHLRSSICAFMQSCVSMTMPQSRLHLIGSCVNGTTVSDSDLDFVVELPSYAPCTAAQFLCCLSQVLCSQQRGLVDNVERVLNARVPIVRCEVYRTRCDVSCHVLLGVHNSGLLRVYCSADSRVRVLAVLTKYWAGRRNIRNPYERTLSSYGYVLLLIAYLQKVGVVPNLQSPLAIATKPPLVLGTYDCTYQDIPSRVPGFVCVNTLSPPQLLFGFFSYIGYSLDWQREAASVRCGGFVPKGMLRGQMNTHPDWRLCVEDPFEHDSDVTRTLLAATSNRILYEFRRAASIMALKGDFDEVCADDAL